MIREYVENWIPFGEVPRKPVSGRVFNVRDTQKPYRPFDWLRTEHTIRRRQHKPHPLSAAERCRMLPKPAFRH
ncbi:MAG: hypothetical protein J0L62_15730 [Bacteroidetes bacterium]|nr:hypothetical protein [Bacteroidota bacterium]